MVDIDVEHTGNVDIMTSAIVSVGIRLWPYHMSGDVYGVSASFADTGIKFYYWSDASNKKSNRQERYLSSKV